MKQLYEPVAVTLLTGFLGSGKTTLINDLVGDPRMADTAVIINEFGAIAIDHDLVRTGSERYMRTTTGCLCCSAASDIRTSLYELHEARMKGEISSVGRVVIETTGLADPAPIINSVIPGGAPALGLRDHAVARHFYLQSVITTFDTIDGRSTLASFIEGWKQLAFADEVILTKTDAAREERDWAAELGVLNPAARFHDRHAPGFDLVSLFGATPYSVAHKAEDVVGWLAMERLSPHPEHEHDPNRHGDEIEVFSLSSDVPLDPDAIGILLAVLVSPQNSGLLRMKGLIAVSDDPERPMVVHAVQHKMDPTVRLPRWPGEERGTRLVLIGMDLPEKQIRELFAALTARSQKSRRKPA
ncbi:CobW family GTP-binding protein [Martelella soudanensis]|uniref:CobW family GTP-binding protein n=1 Tax=unclassified Martelella TaxID=2629616 RepID=UPI001FEE44D4|nr:MULTISPECIES: GTP-binding protein [unclassified Martelella]